MSDKQTIDQYINTIHNIDCLEFMRQLPDNCIDLIITSPPYNVGIKYVGYNDSLSVINYLLFIKNILIECKRILKLNGGRICLNIPIEVNLPYRYSPLSEYCKICKDIGLSYSGIKLWVDNTRVNNTAWGSFSSPSAPYIYNPYEAILLHSNGLWKKEGLKENIDIDSNNFKQWIVKEWNFSPEHNRTHPSPFPIELPKRLIQLLSYKNDIVFDPFMGSGTTCISAINLDRKFIGTEISQQYFNMAQERIIKAQAQGRLEL